MKINHMPLSSPAHASETASGKKTRADDATPMCPAGPGGSTEVTQSAMHAAQDELRKDSLSVDTNKVAQMQALIESGQYPLDYDALSGEMLNYYRNGQP